MKSVTIEKRVMVEIEVGLYRVLDQDDNNLVVNRFKADRDGDLIIEVEVPNKQCTTCRCRCDD